jgi:hypothetical protein
MFSWQPSLARPGPRLRMKMVDRLRIGRVLQDEPGLLAIRLPDRNGHTSDAMLTPINILLAKNHRPELLVGDSR